MSVSAFSISQRDTALDAIAIVQNLLSSPALLASIPVCKTARRFVVQLKALLHAAGEQSRLDGLWIARLGKQTKEQPRLLEIEDLSLGPLALVVLAGELCLVPAFSVHVVQERQAVPCLGAHVGNFRAGVRCSLLVLIP